MLGGHIVDAKMEDNNKRNNDNTYNSEVEHRMIINWTPPDEKKFLLRRRFVSPRMLSKSIPRRNKSLFQYKMNRSLNLDITNSRKNSWLKSPNSSFDSSSDADKSSSRDLSRSAKIMRALSLNHSLIRHKNIGIKKSLNFDSPPSTKKDFCFDRSPHSESTSVNTSVSPTLDKLLCYDTSSFESITSSVLVSSESIDENQNQTPQKTRKVSKISSGTSDAKENLNHSSESSSSTSLLRSNLKERIDNILHIVQTPDLQSFKRERSRTLGCVASTPRNLFQEFNQDEYDRPHTPENIMRLIPESMSAIKKSHKKEKLYRQEEDMCIQQIDVSTTNEDFYIKSSGADNIIAGGSCNTASIKKSQMKKRNFKKTLTYDSDDELSDNRSISDHSAQWNEISPREDNLLENRSNEAKINKIQDINLSDEKCEESIQDNDNIHFVDDNNKEKDYFNENDCDEEICLTISQRESSCIRNVNVSYENVMVPPASNPPVSQNSSRAVTPENHINILQQILTESIKKSHKKVKHENKKIFKLKNLHQKMESVQDARNNSKCENIVNVTCPLNSQNSIRPNTPDNINSSRLLLTYFNSVKKSHKKDKHKKDKRISGLAKCHKYQEYRKKNGNSIQNNRDKDINEILHKESFGSLELKDSPDVSPNKKKKSMNVQSETCRLPYSKFSSLGYKSIEDEFKIYTPIKKTLKLLTASNCVCTDEMSSKKDESVQAMSKEVDFSRCMTPIAHCSRKLRENEDAISEEYAHADKSKTDASMSHDEVISIADSKDKNGRLTPINMSTIELLCNINSIKKSHKKNKHSRSICKRGGKELLHNEETKNISFANNTTTLEEHASSALQFFDACSPSIETGMCSSMRDVREDKNYEETIYNNPQPSTSRTNDSIRNVTNVNETNLLNATPPNDFNTANFLTLFNTTSIKKFHKKERDYNAETKYILMSNEHDLSDDGSIFSEEDKLNIAENFDLC